MRKAIFVAETQDEISQADVSGALGVNGNDVEAVGGNRFVVSFGSQPDYDRVVLRGGTLAEGAKVTAALNEIPRPYAHVHVPDTGPTLPRTLHDKTIAGRRSGELLCTLRTLTPLLAGNEQYAISDSNIRLQRASGEKKVLEPLFDEDGRVLIPGEQLKGMLRQSVGALLGAPMERVAEQTYSYRPNLAFEPGNKQVEPRPAVVVSLKTFGRYTVPDKVKLCDINRRIFDMWPRSPHDRRYRGGMEAYEGPGNPDPVLKKCDLHTRARPTGQQANPVEVPDETHEQWLLTVAHLTDTTSGHISSRHPSILNTTLQSQAKTNLQRAVTRGFKEGDVIYVEWDTVEGRVVSYGHHYYYRWRYADSVREKWAAATRSVRSELKPLPSETVNAPDRLSGARALFGFCSDNPGSDGVGTGDQSQLAGRIAFNYAREVVEQVDNLAKRFLGTENRGYCVALKELGTPKPSAVEFYLDQTQLPARRREKDQGVVVTYGDLPGRDPTGDLAGRKFYRHCPQAATDKSVYESWDTEIIEKRSTLARFATRPQRTFKFTVRFRNLSDEELGVLLIALCPNQYAPMLPEPVRSEAGVKPVKKDRPRYATKLGHARPLGWGSVEIKVDRLRVLCSEGGFEDLSNADVGTCLSKCGDIVDRPSLRAWLDIHDFIDSKWGPYPTAGNADIFRFHSGIRQLHSKGRRRFP
jgi:hypothetical protein